MLQSHSAQNDFLKDIDVLPPFANEENRALDREVCGYTDSIKIYSSYLESDKRRKANSAGKWSRGANSPVECDDGTHETCSPRNPLHTGRS